MADRGLTAREFWKLPPEERMKRCGELSEHEAFVARLTDPTPPVSPLCNRCKHYFGYAKCEAFPEGIPADHIRAVMENQTVDCGNGRHYTLGISRRRRGLFDCAEDELERVDEQHGKG